MRTTIFSKKVLFMGIVVMFGFSVKPACSQQRDLEREILVYIMQDSLKFSNPREEKSPASLEVSSKKLKTTLGKLNVMSVSKAFPDASDSDSVKVREDGEKVRLPKTSRIFRFVLTNKNDVDDAISALSKEPSVLFAERHSRMQLHTDDYYSNQWH